MLLYAFGALVVGMVLIAFRLSTRVEQPVGARVPAIDLHTHLGGVETWPGQTPNFREILDSMDARHIALVVDFKAPYPGHEVYGERVSQRLARYPDPNRFKLFANVPLADSNHVFLAESVPNYAEWVAGILQDSIGRGASGLKLKFQAGTGYWVYDSKGVLVPLDTPSLDRLWEKASNLRIPVLLHFGSGYKADHQPGGALEGVRWEMLMYERERVLRRHPRLILIGAHWGSSAQDLSYLWELLDRYPNFYVEGSAHQAKDVFGTVDPYKGQFLTRFQDRILFGTDYMEATMPWLTSYRQRLDMILPWIERWPVPQTVLAKYYGANARKILHLNRDNAIPVAHAGFPQTRLVGDLTTLNGGGSYDFEGSPLTYRWRQVSGPTVRLSSPTSPSPTFTPREEGVYGFELVVDDGEHPSAPRQVAVTVVGGDHLFRESNGLVVIEAEDYWRKTDRGGRRWTFAHSLPGFSGQGYMEIGSAPGASVEIGRFRSEAAELAYKVWITTPGTYVVYLRGSAHEASGGSVHVGLDGEEVRLADRIGPFPGGTWSWVHETRERNGETGHLDRNLAVLNIAEPGPHLISVWIGEGGLKLDKLILARPMSSQTRFPLFDPGPGVGPGESPYLTGN